MNTTKLSTLLVLPVVLLLVASPAVAQEIDGFWPGCGAAGDKVLIRGSDFADEPAVSIGGTSAEVLRSREDAILCIVPDDLVTGAATLTVDSEDAADDFVVLAEGTPVVYRLSTDTGPAGLSVYVFGRRLHGAEVAFVDDTGTTQAEAELEGGRRCNVFEVPEDLDVGTYTLVFTNEDALDTFDCPISFEVVEAGDPTITALDPELVPPGQRVVVEGTDLTPHGWCRVIWTDADGETIRRHGFSNGYDRVFTCVPYQAVAAATYDVSIELRDGTETAAVSYDVGERGDPVLTSLEPDAGPTGTHFALLGEDLVASGLEPTVTFDDGTTTTEAEIHFALPGFHGHGGVVVATVPDGLADGDYDVTLTLDGAESNALTYTVGALPLAVTRMMPTSYDSDRDHRRGPRPVAIEGTGFGSDDSHIEIQVVWDDGTDTYEGEVLLRSDRLLFVAVPGDEDDPLPVGTYTVYVVLDPDDTAESVEAGTYTVM